MIQRIEHFNQAGMPPVSLRCPGCRQQGVFEILSAQDVGSAGFFFGQRRCPNPACWTHVFVVRKPDGSLIAYPTARLDFDATNIPQPVVATFEEALTCHANECFTACAMMVRKT